MNQIKNLKMLRTPTGIVDVVLDTDTYNEIDDQFALSYLLRANDRLNTLAITAAPFFNEKSTGPKDGMEKSYDEIMKLLKLANREDMVPNVFKGSECYLQDEKTPVESPAAREIVRLAKEHNDEHPLYVVAIGAITNVASAILMDPTIVENMVVVWLGGHDIHWRDTSEFNMRQDVAAARVVFLSPVPVVQLPCCGVVSNFYISQPELERFLIGANPLADYLGNNVIEFMNKRSNDPLWSKVVWDVTAVGWLLNEKQVFMNESVIHAPIPEYDNKYAFSNETKFIKYVWNIKRDNLYRDLFAKLKK